MKLETKLKKQYESQPEEVRDYMYALIDQLLVDYGAINPSWALSLDMICDWYHIYVDAKNDLFTNGTTFTNSRGDICKNPAFSAMNTSSSHMQNLLKSFAASPYQKSKMKSLDKDAIRDESDYIKSIMEN